MRRARLPIVALATAGLLASASGRASAALIDLDLASPGDQLVTRDTETGLDWLDLTLTTDLTVAEIVNGAGGWLAGGWRYATPSEVLTLWSNLGIALSFPLGSPDNVAPGRTLIEHLGNTSGRPVEPDSSYYTWGALDHLLGAGPALAAPTIRHEPGSPEATVASLDDYLVGSISYRNPYLGHWLVRVPEPSVTLLSLSGIAACAVQRRSTTARRLRPRLAGSLLLHDVR